MKIIIIVFFACGLALASAVYYNATEDEKSDVLGQCGKELNLNLGIMFESSQIDKKYERDIGCILECVHKKIGWLNADGSLNIEYMTKTYPDATARQKIMDRYQNCVEQGKGDSCMVSLCLR